MRTRPFICITLQNAIICGILFIFYGKIVSSGGFHTVLTPIVKNGFTGCYYMQFMYYLSSYPFLYHMFVILGVRYPDTQKVKVKMSYENLSTNTKRSIKVKHCISK